MSRAWKILLPVAALMVLAGFAAGAVVRAGAAWRCAARRNKLASNNDKSAGARPTGRRRNPEEVAMVRVQVARRVGIPMKAGAVSGVVLLALCVAGSAMAQTKPLRLSNGYPNKAVRIIVGNAPGGGSDTIGRLIGQKLTERFGQTFFVENRAGAGGLVGMEMAAKAEPDGYTLYLASGSGTVNAVDRKSTRLNSSHTDISRMPSSA